LQQCSLFSNLVKKEFYITVIWIPLAFANAATMTIVNLADSHLNPENAQSVSLFIAGQFHSKL